MTLIDVEDPAEHEAARMIVGELNRARELSKALDEHNGPYEGSPMREDDLSLGKFPVSYYVFGQLQSAFGCLEATRDLIIRDETENSISFVTGTQGPYALLRNAIDCAGLAYWILQPVNGKLRRKRYLMAEYDELEKSVLAMKESGIAWRETHARISGGITAATASAGVSAVGIKGSKLPTMTAILRQIEQVNPDRSLSWLGHWQLCSGQAHGKRWATLAMHEKAPIEGTEDGVGAKYMVTMSYGALAHSVWRTVNLLQVATARLLELSGSPTAH